MGVWIDDALEQLELERTAKRLDFAQVSPERVRRLRAMRPRGVDYQERQIRCWVARTLPELEARWPGGTPRSRWQRLVNWWRRASWREVQECELWVYHAALDEARRSAEGGGSRPDEEPEVEPGGQLLISSSQL